MENKIPTYLLQPPKSLYGLTDSKTIRQTFLDKTILNSANAAKSIYIHAESADKGSLIQKIHPNIKLISLLFIAVIISLNNNLIGQIVMTGFILLLFLTARLKVFTIYKKIVFLAFIFGFLVVLPASLNIITPGRIIFNFITLNKPLHFWIYNIPENIGLTDNGIHVVLLIFLRVLNSISFAMLIVFSTSFPAFLKSFKILRIPDTFLMIVSLAYKYIFILSRTVQETYLALRSRMAVTIKNKSIQNLVGNRILFIFKRSGVIYENTYYAMVSRGYQGKVILHSNKKIAVADIVALVIIIVLGICTLFL